MLHRLLEKAIQSQRFHSSIPSQQEPNCAVLSSRTLFSSTRRLRVVGRRLDVRGKQLQSLALALLVEDFDRLQPARLGVIVQLTRYQSVCCRGPSGVGTVSTSDQ